MLRSLTVCDPTVGSGAFLFAALDVLEPLYCEVLARAEELEARGESVPAFLAEARAHPSSRCWLLKKICLHNLFGVDIMREAPEIAKLRLFLKLAAQVERVEHLEPLPDLDFNIKCGNLLVGIADERDATGRLGDGRLDLGGTLANIAAVAAAVAGDYDSFVAQQTQTSTADHADAKARLASRFDAARAECDRLLADLRHEEGDLDGWVASHQPFHWFVEFPSVWQQGGFDVIIGNPPYIKTSKVTGYRWLGYATQNCPDLYAVCMERASTLLNDHGRFAMIVMHSLCFSRQFMTLREELRRSLPSLWVSSYARRPDSLFAGSAAVRNSIAIGASRSRRTEAGLRVTRIRRWSPEMRQNLFTDLRYQALAAQLPRSVSPPQWPYIEDSILTWALGELVGVATDLNSAMTATPDSLLGYKTTALYQLGVYVDEPPTVDPVTREPASTNSSRTGWLSFENDIERDLALVALAGRWGYLWWITFSDEFDVTRSTLAAFPGDIKRLASLAVGNPASGDMKLVSLLALSRTLQEEMPKHIAWMKKAGVDIGRYNMAKLRHLTDRADWLLARAWGIEDAFEAAGNLRDRMVFGNRE